MQKEIEEIRLRRQEDYERKLEKDQTQAIPSPTNPSNEIRQVRYETTQEELEATTTEPVISPEEVEWNRQHGLIEPSKLCSQVCQIQAINEPNHEGTCSIKDVGVDTIYTFTKPIEDESATSSYDSDDSNRSSIYNNNYSTTHYDYSIMNDEILCTVTP